MPTFEQQALRLSLALKGAKSGFWDWNIAEGKIYFGPNYYLIAGYEPYEFPHHYDEWKKRTHPEDVASAEEVTRQYFSGEIETFAVEFRFKTKSGDWMWILGRGEITERDPDGKPTRFIGLHVDISHHKAEEELLRKERDFSKSLIDTAQSIVLVLDTEGRIAQINPYMEAITGYKQPEVEGKDWFDTFLPKDDHSELRALFKKSIANIEVNGQINPILAKNRQEIQVEWFNKTLTDIDGNVIGVLCIGQDITERIQAEKALRDSENKFKLLANHTHDWEYWRGSNGEYLYVSPACERLTGYKVEEFMGNSNLLCDIVKPGYAEKLQNHFCDDGISHFSMELPITTKNGEDRWLVHSCIPVYNDQGDYVGRRGNNRDITERKQAEESLKKSEERFKRLASVTYEGILIHNKGIAIDANESLAKMFGYSREELTGQDMIELLVPCEYRPLVKENFVKTIAGPYEVIGRKKDGTFFPVEIESRDISGEKDSFQVSALRDIAVRKQTEIDLQDGLNKLSSIFRAAPTGIGVVVDRKIKFANDRFAKMVGYSEAELVGSDSRMVYPSDAEFEWVGKEKYKQIQERGTGTVETVLQKKDGTLIDVLLSSTPLDLQDLSQGVTFTALDITERKEAEKNRLELETQLHQKHKMEAIGVMAGGMAHNFNNVLAIILGNVELAQLKQVQGTDFLKLLKNIKTAAIRARDLIQQIQTYSRNTEHEKVPVLLPSIINETVNLLRSTLPSTVNLQQTHSSDVTVNADASQLQEVLINLANNAIHAMDECGDLTISLEVVELKQKDIPHQYSCSAGIYAKISVQDTGSGMTEKTRKKIFDPFFTTKEVGVGTGMGLATVQGIVDQHNGLIKVVSELDLGTTFELYFPVSERRGEERDQTIAPLPTGTEKILFLDDEEVLADTLSQMLREHGYEVSTMSSSIKSLKLFESNPDYFDLVISDQTMPDLSGKELIKKLLAIRPDLATILCTGYSTKIDEEEAKQLGISAFCLKPLEVPTLLQIIRQVLDDGKN